MISASLLTTDPTIAQFLLAEERRQSHGMELIASENYQSQAVLEAQASLIANKYAEWTPGRRYYGGQEFTDQVEQLAIDRAKEIFHADHANVQALSGAAANVCAYAAFMEPGDVILGMDLSHGGHLTHGAPVTFLSKVFRFERYKTLPDGSIDFDQVRSLALQHRPKVILAGFSAYPRELDYAKFVEIANEVWAIAYADVSHIWGLIAAGVLQNPLDHGFHAMMTTTHKSLRGPRWALILSKWIVSNPLKKPEDTIENIPTRIDRAVFPGVQWWPHMNTIAAIAVALHEAATPQFKAYAQQTILNAKAMSESFLEKWYTLVTGGTDNHMMVLDLTSTGMHGWEVQEILDKVGISTSKSTIPDDPNPPFKPSGLRIGTPAMTTRGIKEADAKRVVDVIHEAINHKDQPEILDQLRQKVVEFCSKFPVPGVK